MKTLQLIKGCFLIIFLMSVVKCDKEKEDECNMFLCASSETFDGTYSFMVGTWNWDKSIKRTRNKYTGLVQYETITSQTINTTYAMQFDESGLIHFIKNGSDSAVTCINFKFESMQGPTKYTEYSLGCKASQKLVVFHESGDLEFEASEIQLPFTTYETNDVLVTYENRYVKQ